MVNTRYLFILSLLFISYCSANDSFNNQGESYDYEVVRTSNIKKPAEEIISADVKETHIHRLIDIAIDKLSSKVMMFACATSEAPPLKCKTYDTMTICFDKKDIVVMGIPLLYKEHDTDLELIRAWIDKCHTQNKTENAYITETIIDRLRLTTVLYKSGAHKHYLSIGLLLSATYILNL